MKKPLSTDPALWFFGTVALACLTVSIPATSAAMRLFHGVGWGLAAVVVFEIGAVGAELATIAIPQWRKRLMLLTIVLLLATTGTNYAHGADEFAKAALPRTYQSIAVAGYGWLLATVAAGMFPALLFVFLTAFTARWRMLKAGLDTPWRAVAFWVSTFGQYMSTRVDRAEQARNEAEQRAALAEQRAADLEQRLHSRPAPVEVEVIQVARAQLTLDQAAELFGMSKSTLRRRVAQLPAPVAQEV
jgi:DNA-binding transcriptional regulator YiaG